MYIMCHQREGSPFLLFHSPPLACRYGRAGLVILAAQCTLSYENEGAKDRERLCS
jgi:hypothetical protein